MIVGKQQCIKKLTEVYCSTEGICLFTGAGVSFTQHEDYRAPGWDELLHELLEEILGPDAQPSPRKQFEALKAALESKDPWDLGTEVRQKAATEKLFVAALRRVVIKKNETSDKAGRLKLRNFRGASTMNAIVSFCSEVDHIEEHPCFRVNPRIQAILTGNYDWFLEGAGTLKCQTKPLKPMSRPTSTVQSGRIPVYHIHGYLPSGKPVEGADPSAEQSPPPEPTEPLIIDRAGYKRTYAPGSWALGVLQEHLRSSPTIFIGFSFVDEYLLDAVRVISGMPGTPRHYALLIEKDEDRPEGLLGEVEQAGVTPLLYERHSDIPFILADVYQSALADEDLTLRLELEGSEEHFDRSEIWDMLWYGKDWSMTWRQKEPASPKAIEEDRTSAWVPVGDEKRSLKRKPKAC
ncbi:MAG: SIR2 family protein [Candidatus Bipolaricaulia bacterium]